MSRQERKSLLLGFGVDGPVAPDWNAEIDFSFFDILRDRDRSHARTGVSSDFKEFNDTGWVTADAKLRTQRLAGRDDLGLVVGYHFEQYELGIRERLASKTSDIDECEYPTFLDGQ